MKPLSWYRDLLDTRMRRQSGCFLVDGPRAVEQIHLCAPREIVEILAAESFAGDTARFGYPVRRLADRQYSSLVTAKSPQGIAAVVRIPEGSYGDSLPDKPGSRLLLLYGIQDPGNVGTIIRTASGFDFGGIVLSGECADPFSPKAVQASAGSVLSVWLRHSPNYLNIARNLKLQGFALLGATMDGIPVKDYNTDGSLGIMLGSEGTGLSKELLAIADIKVTIPINRAKIESLNVAVAGAILMNRFSNI
jgi:TrmH family RNA methyltransferase